MQGIGAGRAERGGFADALTACEARSHQNRSFGASILNGSMQEVLTVIRQLRDQGITIVLVEQNVHNALSVANRAYVLTTGRIVAEDTTAGLLKNPDLLRAYLGG
jgi:ABC-type lipopolysaccharide export system ATPase subunit